MIKKLAGACGCFLAFAAIKDAQAAGYLTAFEALSGVCLFLLIAAAIGLFVWAFIGE